MNSPARMMTMPSHSLPAQLEQIGLRAVPGELDDFLAVALAERGTVERRRQIVPVGNRIKTDRATLHGKTLGKGAPKLALAGKASLATPLLATMRLTRHPALGC